LKDIDTTHYAGLLIMIEMLARKLREEVPSRS
jgi:hypothetical protein